MLLGMMIVGAGAVDTGFEDDASISDSFKEAATVTKALGVMQGNNGNLNAKANIVRAEAFILALQVDGSNDSTIAANWPVSVKPFNDVSTGKWYAHHLAYGKEMGLISGNGGNYNPDGDVTTVEYAIMLLRRLGLDPDGTRYTGAGWNTNAAKDAVDAKLFEGLGNINYYNHQLTREEACQMAFNAITKYSPSGSNGYVLMDGDKPAADYKDVVFSTLNDAVLAKLASGSAANKWTVAVSIPDDTLAATVYGLKQGTTEDAFGRTLKTWSVAGVKDPIYTSDEPVGASVTYFTKQNLKKEDVSFVDGGAALYENSAKTTGKVNSAEDLNKLTGNGVRVDVYSSAGKIEKVVVVETALVRISRISAKTVALSNVAGAKSLVVGEKNPCFETLSGMAKDDLILVTVADGEVRSVVEPEVVTGVTKSNTEKGINIDGTVYPFAKVDDTVSKLPVDAAKTATIYVDERGNAFYGTSEAAPAPTTEPYIYVTAAYKTTGKYSPDGTADIEMIQGVQNDGTVVEWRLNGSSEIDFDTVSTAVASTGALYGCERQSDGSYKLTGAVTGTDAEKGTNNTDDIGAISADGARLKRTKQGATTLYADDVNFIYVDGKGSDLTVTNLAGVHEVASSKTIWWIGKAEGGASTAIKTVFVANTKAPVESEDLIYVAKELTGSTKRYLGKDDKTTLYAYDVYLNGEVVKDALFAKKAVDNGEVGLHTYTVDGESGAYELGRKITEQSNQSTGAADVAKTAKGSYFVKDMKATDAVIVDTRSNVGTIGKITDIGELYDAAQDWTLTVSYVDVDKEILYIYIQDAAIERTVTGSLTVETVAAGEKITVDGGATLTVTGDVEKGAIIVMNGEKLTVKGTVYGKIEANAGTVELGTVGRDSEVSVSADITEFTAGDFKDAVELVMGAKDLKWGKTNDQGTKAVRKTLEQGVYYAKAGVYVGGEVGDTFNVVTVYEIPDGVLDQGGQLSSYVESYTLTTKNGKTLKGETEWNEKYTPADGIFVGNFYDHSTPPSGGVKVGMDTTEGGYVEWKLTLAGKEMPETWYFTLPSSAERAK
ncbi:MAG: S-layer homology domain-containing protein [Roseburia sp.]|nr:S-layer homology domain-containing protein [Roseburia sp.]